MSRFSRTSISRGLKGEYFFTLFGHACVSPTVPLFKLHQPFYGKPPERGFRLIVEPRTLFIARHIAEQLCGVRYRRGNEHDAANGDGGKEALLKCT